MISIATGTQKAQAATLDQPLDHLSACHRRIEQRLDTLERAAPLLWERREAALQAIRNAFAFLDTSGVHHTEDEEESLFPRLQGKLQPADAALIASLESDHRTAHRLYADLQSTVERIATTPSPDEALSNEYADLVARFCTLYRHHIRQEDSQLIDMSKAVLSDAELAEISSEMKRRRGV